MSRSAFKACTDEADMVPSCVALRLASCVRDNTPSCAAVKPAVCAGVRPDNWAVVKVSMSAGAMAAIWAALKPLRSVLALTLCKATAAGAWANKANCAALSAVRCAGASACTVVTGKLANCVLLSPATVLGVSWLNTSGAITPS